MKRAAILVLILVAACSKSDNSKSSTGSASFDSVPAEAGTALRTNGTPDPTQGSGSGSSSGSGSAPFDSVPADAGTALRANGTPDPTQGSGSGSGSGSSAGSGSGSSAFKFDDLSDNEKAKFMREKVVPAMKPEFKGYDAKDFAKFNCKTCHGKGAITKEYKMPNPDLPKLDFAELKAGKHAEMAKFMKDTVTPKMAAILNQPERSRTNPDGFGCLECHEEKKK